MSVFGGYNTQGIAQVSALGSSEASAPQRFKCISTSIKNHFYKMKRDIGMADYEKQVKQEFHTPSLYLCFVIGA